MSNFQNQKQQTGSGLTRYRSAPSSYFSNLLNTNNTSSGFGAEDYEQLFNPRASSPETQRIFPRLVGNSEPIQENRSQNMYVQSQSQSNSEFLPPRNSEPVIQHAQQPLLQRQQSNAYSSVSQIMYQDINSGTTNNSYSSLLGSNLVAQIKMEGGSGGNSGLIRQSSSPAGLFANTNIEKEFGAMRGMGDFGAGNSSTSRFNNSRQIDFSSSRRSSTSGMMMTPISEIGNGHIKENNSVDVEFDEGDSISGFPVNGWDDSAIFSDNFLNELAENENKAFSNPSALDDQRNEGGNHSRTRLAHHLSMPTSSAELSAMEKLSHDSVPCKIRAKRGFATHPRSIAERVRRTKISERMRKLQELVPNMEKQTNTSDMLDLAVDYIKDLQTQVTKLSDTKEKCSCLGKDKL